MMARINDRKQKERSMDQVDEQILELMKGNARISYQEIGDSLGMSRVAAKKRVKKGATMGVGSHSL